jgi:hypothetical protein
MCRAPHLVTFLLKVLPIFIYIQTTKFDATTDKASNARQVSLCFMLDVVILRGMNLLAFWGAQLRALFVSRMEACKGMQDPYLDTFLGLHRSWKIDWGRRGRNKSKCPQAMLSDDDCGPAMLLVPSPPITKMERDKAGTATSTYLFCTTYPGHGMFF